jgi:hypothetical protein
MENIILVLSLIVGIIGMVRFKKLTMPFKLLVIWQFINFSLDACNGVCIAIYKNNALLSHVENICEYISYAIIYYFLFKSRKIKKVILSSIVIIFIFFIINGLFLQPFTKTFPTNLIMVREIMDVLFAILLFKQMLQYPVQINIMKQSIFWFNTAILFFSTTMFLNLGLLNYYGRYHREDMTMILYFWYSIDIIFSILLTIAILNDHKNEIADNG